LGNRYCNSSKKVNASNGEIICHALYTWLPYIFRLQPWRDYEDIIDFDYDKPGTRQYKTGAMKFWVKEFDIDGYRCVVARFVRIDFWENARRELEAI